ncbi:MAG: LptF/LptG family permease [Fervidobacterium sp.]|uniref:LptF/LptG family permease n=1 Tax=Fervidobacterium sp. TaxID=1871331 RepID=UPI00404B37ED
MKTLTKYVLKQSLKPFFMGLGGFIVFVSVEWLYQISDYIIRNRVDISKLFLFVLYNLPYFTVLGIPVGVLFAIFWVISEMYTNREITAILVHGISSKRLVTPFVILSIILGFFAWLMNDYVVPNANYKSSQVLNQYILQSPETVVKTNMLVELEKDVYFYVKEYNKQAGELSDVVLFRNEEGNEQILTSKKVIKKNDGWYLLDGNMYVIELETGFLKLDMQFKEMKLDVAGEIEQMLRAYKTTRDKTSRELREQLETYKKLGINTASLVVELHQRYANALGSLVIVLIGLPLSLLFGFTSRSWSVILTFLIVVLYQGSGAWLSGMGKEGLLDPVLATWLPNIFFSVAGFLMYILMDTPFAYKFREVLSRFFSIVVFIAVFGIFLSSQGFAGDIKVTANSFSLSENYASIKDKIVIEWDKYRIECDEATATLVDGKVKSIFAAGNVNFFDGDRKYIAKSLNYEFEKERGIILNAKTVYNYDYKGKKVPIYLSGTSIELPEDKDRENEVIISDPQLTTCNLEEPHYVILSDEVYVIENKYIIAKNSFLVVLGVPTFPYPIFLTKLEGTAPYSFSIVFGNTLGVTQTFAFAVNDWNNTLSLTLDSVLFTSENAKNKSNKVSYDSKNDRFEFSMMPLTYRYSKGTVYYKFDSVVFLEGSFVNSSNYYHRAGLNLQSSNIYFKPYISYDGKIADTIVYLNGGVKGITFNVLNDNRLTFGLDGNVRLQTDGYLTSLDKSWNTSYQTKYNLNVDNSIIRYNASLNGDIRNNGENRSFNYAYQIPWNARFEGLFIDFLYRFNIKWISNITTTKNESFGLTDNYTLNANYGIGPLRVTGAWEQSYAFLDEPTSTNKNLLRMTVSVSSQNITTSVARSVDLINNKQLPDSCSIKYSQDFGSININGSLSGAYDNVNKKLGNETISVGTIFKDLQTSYTLQYTIVPGKPVSNFVHNFKYSNLTATLYQENDFVKRAIVSGSFMLFDYSAKLNANYFTQSKDAQPNYNFTLTLEKKDEKYTLSYNTDNTKKYVFETQLKTIDPNVSLKVRYNPDENKIETGSIVLDKSLHCWRLSFGLDFSYKSSGTVLDYVDKVTFKFYLTDIPDIFFFLSPKEGQFQFSGM